MSNNNIDAKYCRKDTEILSSCCVAVLNRILLLKQIKNMRDIHIDLFIYYVYWKQNMKTSFEKALSLDYIPLTTTKNKQLVEFDSAKVQIIRTHILLLHKTATTTTKEEEEQASKRFENSTTRKKGKHFAFNIMVYISSYIHYLTLCWSLKHALTGMDPFTYFHDSARFIWQI